MQYRQDIATRTHIAPVELITISIVTIRNICQLCGRFCCVLENFCRKFANLVAPPTDGTTKRLVHCEAHPVLYQMSKTASKPMHNWRRYPSSKWEKWPKNAVLNLALCCGAIWRQREKLQHRLQSILYTTAQKDFGKFTSCMTFGAHKLVHSEAFLDYPYEIWQLLSALYSDVQKKIYRCTSTVSALNYCNGFFSNPSAIYTKWCAQPFPPIFGLFAIFDRNFAKIVAPPSNEYENCVVHLKEQSLLKKLRTSSKSAYKR